MRAGLAGLAWLAFAQPAAATPDAIATKCARLGVKQCRAANSAPTSHPAPAFVLDPEPAPTETLADAIDLAWRTAPTVQQQRYRVRMADENVAQALAETRPNATMTITGLYAKTAPGGTTQALRLFAGSPIITSNTQTTVATLNQPLLTGGRAYADHEAALAEVGAGRETLRGTEGTLLFDVMAAYADIRRDVQALRFYTANQRQMVATRDEVMARQVAGELTRTDIGLAETQLAAVDAARNSAVQQLEQDRASFAALVGRNAGVLAEPPPLPGIPPTIDVAFDLAETNNPDLGAAIATEQQSRAQIASARATGRPTLMFSTSATLTGQGAPFMLRNQDQTFAGQAVLTIPLFSGGAIRSRVAQAQDRNGIDRFGIEAARRQMVQAIVNAWNAMATAQRNVAAAQHQVQSGRVFDEGTFAEYRAGLRSTFDVLFAHSTRRDAEIALVTARRDLFVAQAALLRQLGLLEARTLLQGGASDDTTSDLVHAQARAALPQDPAIRAIDSLQARTLTLPALIQPAAPAIAPALLAGSPPATEPVPIAPHSPEIPVVGTPAADRSMARP